LKFRRAEDHKQASKKGSYEKKIRLARKKTWSEQWEKKPQGPSKAREKRKRGLINPGKSNLMGEWSTFLGKGTESLEKERCLHLGGEGHQREGKASFL